METVAPESRASSRSLAIAYSVSVAAILVSYVWACSSLGFRYPPPWPDEGLFLWPALAIQRDGSLIAPQLNPERPLMWIPPGYMLIQGLIFKVTGFSFQWARTLSALYIAGGIGLLSALFWRLRYPFASLAFCAVFLHSPIVLMVGNTARMEGMVFFFACAGLLLLQRGRMYPGLAVISLLPLIHPIAAYLCLGGAAHWILALCRDRERCRPSRLDCLVIGAALMPWLGYLVHVSTHWDAFLNDMTAQFSEKARLGGGLLDTARSRLPERALAIPGLLITGSGLVAWRRNRHVLILLVAVVPLFLLSATARGWPYEFYLAAMYLLASVLLIGASVRETSDSRSVHFASSRMIPLVLLVVLVAGLDAWAFRREEPLIRSIEAATKKDAASSTIPYVTDSDRQAVGAFLRRQAAAGPVTVMFFPQSDALLFADLESEQLRFVQPAFHTLLADIVILHDSVHLPDWVIRANRSRARHYQGIDRPVGTWRLLLQRDDTESWRATATKPWW